MTTFAQLSARLKNFLRGWLLVLGLKEGLVESATVCVNSVVILTSCLGPKKQDVWPKINFTQMKLPNTIGIHPPRLVLHFFWGDSDFVEIVITLVDEFLWRTFLWRFFVTNFDVSNFCDQFLWPILIFQFFGRYFFTYNLLTMASFRIGVPSILFF